MATLCNQDIFCFEGLELHQLSRLSNTQRNHKSETNNPPDRSRHQIHRLTSRFILLEHHDHFQQIVGKMNANQNLHWIKHDQGNYYYVKSSSGNGVRTIKGFLTSKNPYNISEDEFVERCLDAPRNEPILIYDSPGMGKSVLLTSLARKIKEKRPHSNVIYFQMSELILQVGHLNKNAEKQSLVNYITESKLGQIIMENVLNCEDHQIELFLDAFDEVHAIYLQHAYSMSDFIVKNLKNVRLFIATRPHMRNELEGTLGVLGYNILPFDNCSKLSFFLKYWKTEHCVDTSEQIKQFAEYCLKSVSFELSSGESDIAGIPLQCKMLAEIYALDAKSGGLIPTESQFQFDSIFQMYKHYIDMKFETIISESERQELYDIHVRESIRTLFSNEFEYFWEGFDPNDRLSALLRAPSMSFRSVVPALVDDVPLMDYSNIYKIGILEPSKSNPGRPTFVHITYGEFFAAEFLAKSVCTTGPIKLPQTKFIELFFEHAMMISSSGGIIKHMKFRHPIVNRFLNFFLSTTFQSEEQDSKSLKEMLRIWKNMSGAGYYDPAMLFELLICSLKINADNLFRFILVLYLDLEHHIESNPGWLTFRQNLQDTQSWQLTDPQKMKLVEQIKRNNDLKELVFIGAGVSSFELVKMCCQFLEAITGNKFHHFGYKESPIRVALERGHYQICEYLLSFDKNKFYQWPILHWCLRGSAFDSSTDMGDKVQIVKMILNEKPDMLNKHPEIEDVPLLAYGTHSELIICMIQAGADLSVTNSSNENIAHITAEYFSAEEYHQLASVIISRNANLLFKRRNKEGYTPVHLALYHIDLQSETLELLVEHCNVNFNDNFPGEGSELAIAMKYIRSERVINDIVRLGGDKEKLYGGLLPL